MRSKRCTTLAALAGTFATFIAASAEPLGTAFTVQGRVTIGGASLYGLFDMRFSLFDALSGGNLVAGPLVFDGMGANPGPVSLANGQYSAKVDFGPVFDGRALWLHIELRQHRFGTYVNSTPRQPLAVVPFALWALNGTQWSENGDAIYYLGDVGIGAGDPQYNLHVAETTPRVGPVASPATIGLHYAPEKEPGTDDWFFTAVGGAGNGFRDIQFIRKNGLDLTFGTKNFPGDGPTKKQMILNADGNLGINVDSPESTLHVIGEIGDLTEGGTVIVGNTRGLNLTFDARHIMARDNGAAADLFLNRYGGLVSIGGDLEAREDLEVRGTIDIGLEIVTSDACDPACSCVTVTCPPGKKLLGGGCESGEAQEEIESSHPSGANAWHCRFDSACPNLQLAYAICARVR